MTISQFDISSLDKLSSVALKLLSLSDNRIFVLYGDLGVGKTTLVKSMCSHLKVIDSISSPTFSIINQYVTENNTNVFHFDFYRLKNIEEVDKLGLDIYLSSNNYCFIEWPELAESFLPLEYHAVEIKENREDRELLLLK